jgi:hypothetical protein
MSRLRLPRLRLPGTLSRLLPTGDRPRGIERQLARARPKPRESFARRTGWLLNIRWAATPQRVPLGVQVGALFVAGIVLLLAALAIGS